MTIYETLIKDRKSSTDLLFFLIKFGIDYREIEKHIKEKDNEKNTLKR